MQNKIMYADNNNYWYYESMDSFSNIGRTKSNKKFVSKSNPFTLRNINHYIRINNIKCKLLFTSSFENSTSYLKFKCKCGQEFVRRWCDFRRGATTCIWCSRSVASINYSRIEFALQKQKLTLCEDLVGKCIDDKLKVVDLNGYYYSLSIRDICRIRYDEGKNTYDGHHFISQRNPYSIQNINMFFKNNNVPLQCLSNDFQGNTQDLDIKCLRCHTYFKAKWTDLQSYGRKGILNCWSNFCPTCNIRKIESVHASVLKQIFLHEYPDTIVEERSCVNPLTNYIMPTDIVNHNKKIAIEIQSDFHDNESQQVKDKIKKEFWINKGYSFFDPDIRNYTILQMVQLFFPHITSIPNYIDYNYGMGLPLDIIQNELNSGKSIKQISKELGFNEGSIRSAVREKRLILPIDYKKNILNHKPIVQLNDIGEFVARYDNLSAVGKAGYARGTVIRVLHGKQKMSYHCYWVYEDDYKTGNYNLALLSDRFIIPVDKYDLNNTFIKSYPNIYRAATDSKSSISEIYRIVVPNSKDKNKRTTSHGEKWKLHDSL